MSALAPCNILVSRTSSLRLYRGLRHACVLSGRTSTLDPTATFSSCSRVAKTPLTAGRRQWYPDEPIPFLNNGLLRTDSFDTKYSRKERRRQAALTHLGPLSAEAEELSRSFKSGKDDPFLELNKRIGQGDVSLSIIRVCLQAARDQFTHLKRRDRHTALSKLNHEVTTQVLRHLWADIRTWMPLVLHDEDTLHFLCYFAIAEGLDKYIERWIMADISDQLLEIPDEKWRSVLFRSLIEAHNFSQYNSCNDPAILCLLRLSEWKTKVTEKDKLFPERSTKSKEHFANFFNRFPAICRNLSDICSGIWFRTSPDLFEKFQDLVALHAGKKSGWYDFTKLALYHPTLPNARPFLACLDEMFSTRDDSSMQSVPDNERFKQSCQRTMRRAYVVSKNQGQSQDADRIADHYAKFAKCTIEEHMDQLSAFEKLTLDRIARDNPTRHPKRR